MVGILLLLTLLVGPAATANHLTHRPGAAVALAVAIAVLETWAGITLAYYNKAPVSFFIAAISFALYLAARLGGRLLAGRRGPALAGR